MEVDRREGGGGLVVRVIGINGCLGFVVGFVREIMIMVGPRTRFRSTLFGGEMARWVFKVRQRERESERV